MERSSTERAFRDRVVINPLDPKDAATIAEMRAQARSTKGVLRGISAREPFDALIQHVLPRDDVTFESGMVGSITGLWVHPTPVRSDETILHLHGGWFNFGTAKAYRHLVCMQNKYNLSYRIDDALIDALAEDRIEYVPFFPLGGFTPLQSSTLSEVGQRFDATPAQAAVIARENGTRFAVRLPLQQVVRASLHAPRNVNVAKFGSGVKLQRRRRVAA